MSYKICIGTIHAQILCTTKPAASISLLPAGDWLDLFFGIGIAYNTPNRIIRRYVGRYEAKSSSKEFASRGANRDLVRIDLR